MEYLVRNLIANAGDEAALEAAFLAAGFTAFSFASRSDGRLDLTCYGADAVLPPVVADMCARFPLTVDAERVVSEAELLAGFTDGEACELRPGVWIVSGDDQDGRPGISLRIPPSGAFGDGRHPSTRMAAQLFEPDDVHGNRVLDLGCGTGVLGLLAHAWGAAEVLFSDIDADSLRVTAALAQRHGISEPQVFASDLLTALPRQPIAVLLANIYGDLAAQMLADPALDELLPSGVLVLSGVAHNRIAEVQRAVAAANFTVCDERIDGWWHAMRCER